VVLKDPKAFHEYQLSRKKSQGQQQASHVEGAGPDVGDDTSYHTTGNRYILKKLRVGLACCCGTHDINKGLDSHGKILPARIASYD
jgi:hypothetical protein